MIRCPIASLLALALSILPLAARADDATAPRIAGLEIPGDPRFGAIARDVLLVQAEIAPDFAAQSGLMDDGARVPSFTPRRLAALTRRLRADLAGLHRLPWRRRPVDEQIDVRWIAATAERLDREINVERLYRHRPAAWLEPVANVQINVLTYAPGRTDVLEALARGLPAAVHEMETLCEPTQVDADTARALIGGMLTVLRSSATPSAPRAITALEGYGGRLAALHPARPFAVIGAADYAWRLRHAELLPWTPGQLLALAQRRLGEIELQRAALAPHVAPPGPLPPELEEQAKTLDQASLLGLYDAIQERYRRRIEDGGFVTVPAAVGPVRARVTPDAEVPLTGDGGSMNPPPPWIADGTGWWNVEHFDPAMGLAAREAVVREAAQGELNRMGPYAAHEGLPGHHLQLSIARLHPDPIRKLLQDPVMNEGWALYAEQLMWEHGGQGPSVEAHAAMLYAWRGRARRVVYDVNIETGRWTLQQAADWRHDAAPGQGEIDEDVKRAVNWPAQLVCYFAGKEQILALKADYRRKMGDAYSERRFHDELLALGSIPYVFARAKLLGEPVPDF